MENDKFVEIINKQIKRSLDTLVTKSAEYATEDKLHNFKVAASIEGCSPRQALAGMMAKHTVSIYDMCRDNARYSMSRWNEKITDSINYLLLLRALIEESEE